MADNDKLGDIRINFYTILTQSMYPTIKAGDVVITYKEDNNQYEIGDVITFISKANGSITITHRVLDVYLNNNTFSYRTKGDNNNSEDKEMVDGGNILGKVIVRIPKAGYIQQFLVSETGWIVAILLPSLGIVIYDILKIFKATARKGKSIVVKSKDTDERRKRLKEVLDEDDKEKAKEEVQTKTKKVNKQSDKEKLKEVVKDEKRKK